MVPTWDLVLLVFFGASLIYGFLMGREKVIIVLLGTYVGLVIANQWSVSAFNLLTDQSTEWVSGNISVFMVKVALFITALLIVALRGGLLAHSFMGGSGLISLIVQIGYSLLGAALIAASILKFLPEETSSQIVEGSLIASSLVGYYSWLLILPVALMLMTSFLSRRE